MTDNKSEENKHIPRTFRTGYLVTRKRGKDSVPMAMLRTESSAREYMEECYREDFVEYCMGDSDDAYDLYRQYPHYFYSVSEIPAECP